MVVFCRSYYIKGLGKSNIVEILTARKPADPFVDNKKTETHESGFLSFGVVEGMSQVSP